MTERAACICHRLEPGEECPACDLTDPLTKRERTLVELRERYAWFGETLKAAHAEGKITSQAVRFFVSERSRILLDEDGEPVFNADGEVRIDEDGDPYYFATAQAWSLVGEGPTTRTVAGTMDVALQLLDDRDAIGRVLDILCADFNALHARELIAHG
jgi:hypothetical protein